MRGVLAAVAAGHIASPGSSVDPWHFTAHPDTWFVIAAAAVGYWYALTRIGPRVVKSGPAATRRQVVWFSSGLVVLWLASDWPVHDLAERYLLSAHMFEHLLISFVAPPMLLLGIPGWLTRRLLRPRWAGGTVRVVCRPLVAAMLFNGVVAISHAPFWVNGTLEHHALHFWAHVLLFTAAMIMWFPVVNRLAEFPRLSPPGKMIYLFLQSVIPNVPAAFLAFATGPIYRFYTTVPHPFGGLDVVSDQQLAAAVMKIGGTFCVWGIIVVVFFRWVASEDRFSSAAADRAASAAGAVEALVAAAAGGSGVAGPGPRPGPGHRLGPAPGPGPDGAGPGGRLDAAALVSVRGPAGAEGYRREDAMPEVLTWDHVKSELAKSQPAKPGP